MLIKKNVGMINIFDEVEQKYADVGIDMDENLGFIKKVQAYLLNNFCKRFQGLPVCWCSINITSWIVRNKLFERTGEKRMSRNSFFHK